MDKGFLTEGLMDELMKIASMMGLGTDTLKDKLSSKSNISLSSKIVGSSWKSCKAYNSKGGSNFYSDKIHISKSPSSFEISYSGPSSGLDIAHASSGKDTLHQLYNVLICEINPFLSKGNMKPDIDGITTEEGDGKNEPKLTIKVPLQSSNQIWQLDRRGGWGHDPGPSKMSQKCEKINSLGGECEGPVKNISSGKFGKITEYFITHTI
jgi:hypothetical protein